MPLEEALLALARQFGVTQAQTGRASALSLTAPANVGSLDPSALVGQATQPLESVVQQAPLSLDWVMKDVRFETRDIANLATLGGQPVQGLLAPVTEGAILPPGVPGVLGRLTGTVPVVVTRAAGRAPGQEAIPVHVEVRVRAVDERGQPADLDYRAGAATGRGSEVLLDTRAGTLNLGSLARFLTVALPVRFVPLASSPPPIVRWTLQVAVRLSVSAPAAASTGWVELPPLTVPVPAVPVPTVAAFFVDADFTNAALVVVPSDSPIADVNTLRSQLGVLDAALQTLNTVGAGGFPLPLGLGGVVAEVGRVVGITNLQFRKASEIGNLNDITLIQRGIFENDTEAEDELSSMILIGAPGERITCYNARDFNHGEGVMALTVGPELFATILNLTSTSPDSVPPGRVSVLSIPPGGWFAASTFNDAFSSYRFGRA